MNNNNNGGNPPPDKTQGVRFRTQSVNGNTPNQKTKHNNTAKKPNKPKKFAGHNQGELKGILVLEDATRYQKLQHPKGKAGNTHGLRSIQLTSGNVNQEVGTIHQKGLCATKAKGQGMHHGNEGIDDSLQLKQTLATNYLLQQDQYPSTTTSTLDMLVKDPQGQIEDGNKLTIRTRKQTTTVNLTSRQLLMMSALKSGEDFEETNTFQLLQLGATVDQENDGMSLSTAASNSITLTLSPPNLSARKSDDNDSQPSIGSNSNNSNNVTIPTTVSFTNGSRHYETFFEEDNGELSINLIVNRQMIKDIHQALNGQHIYIHCNSGVARTNLMGSLPGFGPVWFYPEGIANVLSLALVSDHFQVIMDTDVENAIFVHNDDCTRKLIRSPCNLYYYNMKVANTNILTIKTVTSNEKGHSDLDIPRAKKAREIQDILGFPAAEELDIDPVPKDILSLHKHVTLCADIINVNGLNFLVTISWHLKFWTSLFIKDMKQPTLLKAIKPAIGQYKSRGFNVAQLHADNQSKCLKDNLLGKGNPVAPTIERSNRTVKENLRSVFNNLPSYPNIASFKWTTSIYNTTPIKERMTVIPCNMSTMGKFQFLQYIQALREDTKNTMKPCTVDAVYLHPTGALSVIDKLQGVANLLDMPTGINVDNYDTNTGTELESETKSESRETILQPGIILPDVPLEEGINKTVPAATEELQINKGTEDQHAPSLTNNTNENNDGASDNNSDSNSSSSNNGDSEEDEEEPEDLPSVT
eukprot:jgi/Psemu1/12603/gm1.12603_g